MTTALAAKIARDYGTPAAVIDMDRVERNIARIQAACDTAGVANRPHIKTHKSPMLAKLQIAAGARGITCQKLGEGSRPGCRRQRSYGSWPATRRAGPFSRRRAGRERGLQQVAAGRRFPVEHLAGGEDTGQTADHEIGAGDDGDASIKPDCHDQDSWILVLSS
jgi:hypothetical protein